MMGSVMYPNPPQCEKCRKPMRHVATFPVLGTVGKTTGLFHCEPCDHLKWIEEFVASAQRARGPA